MKNLKSMGSAMVLSFALSFSVFGGDIQSPGSPVQSPSPTPPPALCSTCDESSSMTSIGTNGTAGGSSTSTLESELAVYVLLALLSVF